MADQASEGPKRFIAAGCAESGCLDSAAYVEQQTWYCPRTGRTELEWRLTCEAHRDTAAGSEELHLATLNVTPAEDDRG